MTADRRVCAARARADSSSSMAECLRSTRQPQMEIARIRARSRPRVDDRVEDALQQVSEEIWEVDSLKGDRRRRALLGPSPPIGEESRVSAHSDADRNRWVTLGRTEQT